MKWPASITLIRHGQSEYNALRDMKYKDPMYQAFLKAYKSDYRSPACMSLAKDVWEKYGLNVGDYDTKLSGLGHEQARTTGAALARLSKFAPDVVLVSPYLRTRQTLEEMVTGGLDITQAKVVIEDRIREQEHGLSSLYSDWRVFHVHHPEQKLLREQQGPYWYQYPQGESVSMIRDRMRDVTSMMIREFSGLHVMLVTHHLSILSLRANYERLSDVEFIELDKQKKPVNCGVTRYIGNPRTGTDGRLELSEYNTKFY